MDVIQQRIVALEQQVSVLQAENKIRRTLSDYAVAVDEKQAQHLASLFAEDAAIRIPEWNIHMSGREKIMEFYDYYWKRFGHPRRYFSHDVFDISDNTATAFMYWHVTQEQDGDSILGWGSYNWNFRRQEGRWLISELTINILAMTSLAEGWAGSSRLAKSK